jgi:hypothetical protein
MLAEEVVGIHEKSREIVSATRWKPTPDAFDDGLDYAHDNCLTALGKPMVGIFASCCARVVGR